MAEKEIKIEWEGKTEVVVIKEFSFDEYNKVQESGQDFKLIGKQFVGKMNFSKLKLNVLLHGIVKAPFKIDEATIKNLPRKLGETLFKEIDDFNKLDEEKKEESDGQ